MCYESECFDNCSCSLRTKAMVHAIFSIAHGLGFSALFILALAGVGDENPETQHHVAVDVFYTIIGIVHLTGGVFLLMGVMKDMGGLFHGGIFVTSVLPYMLLFSIYFPIVQAIFTASSCRYYRVQFYGR